MYMVSEYVFNTFCGKDTGQKCVMPWNVPCGEQQKSIHKVKQRNHSERSLWKSHRVQSMLFSSIYFLINVISVIMKIRPEGPVSWRITSL